MPRAFSTVPRRFAMRFFPWCAIGLFLAAAAQTQAAEIGYLEDFALSQDRPAALEQLIPGTEDYYYFHCLHLQNTGELDKVDAMLKLWIERHHRTPRVHEIENR